MIGKCEPALAAAYLLAQPQLEHRHLLLQELASAWSQSNLSAALGWMRSLPAGAVQRNVALGLLPEWVAQDAAGAIDGALQMETGAPSLIGPALQSWAEHDAAAVRQWLARQPAGPVRTRAVAAFVEQDERSGDDPRGLVAFLSSLSQRSVEEGETLAGALDRLAEIDFAAALAIAQGQTDATVGARMMGFLLERKQRQDPEGARQLLADWLRRHPLSEAGLPPALQQAARALFQRSAQQDPAAAARWLKTLPGREYLTDEAAEVAKAWATREPAAAWAWAQALPGTTRAQAQQAVLSVAAWQQPQAAIQLARALPDPDDRQAALGTVRDIWLQKDPAAARAWLARERPELREPVDDHEN